MKKSIAFTLAFLLIVSFVFADIDFRKPRNDGNPDVVNILVDWENIKTTDVAPFMYRGKAYLPVRAVLEAYGVDSIQWNAPFVYVVKGDITLQILVGGKKMLVNGIEKTLTETPIIVNGRTCMPIDLVIEALGGSLRWFEEDQTVALYRPVAKDTLNWNLGTQVDLLDPQRAIGTNDEQLINNMYEGLFRVVDNQLEPALAESYDISKDGLVYTFKLRKSLWSDGSPLTAQDFVYSWRRGIDPINDCEDSYLLFYIQGAFEFFEGRGRIEDFMVKALDDYTLQVTLDRPAPYFLAMCSAYVFMPVKAQVAELDTSGLWSLSPETCITNGPFLLAQMNGADGIVLKKNLKYWNEAEVYLDQINCTFVSMSVEAYSDFAHGISHITDVFLYRDNLTETADYKGFITYPLGGVYYYVFNTSQAPLDNPDVRQALSLAIDREELIYNVSKYPHNVATGLVSDGIYDANGESFQLKAGDYGIDVSKACIEEAKALLKKAGYADGSLLPPIELICNTGTSHEAIEKELQRMWSENLGIQVTIKTMSWADLQYLRDNGDFMIARGAWMADYADPKSYLDLGMSNSLDNDSRWENKTFDDLIELSNIQTGQSRYESLYKAHDILMGDWVYLPIYYYSAGHLVSEKVVGYALSGNGRWYFGNAKVIND